MRKKKGVKSNAHFVEKIQLITFNCNVFRLKEDAEEARKIISPSEYEMLRCECPESTINWEYG